MLISNDNMGDGDDDGDDDDIDGEINDNYSHLINKETKIIPDLINR